MAFSKAAADAPSKGLRSLHTFERPAEHIPKCGSIAIDSSEQASGGGPQHHSGRPSASTRAVLSIIPGDAAGPICDGSSHLRGRGNGRAAWPPGGCRQSPNRAGGSPPVEEQDEQEKVEIAAEEVPVPTLHHSRLVMMGRVFLSVRAALARYRAQKHPVAMSGLIFYDFGESFSFSRDFTDIPPPPNPATFHHVDVPIMERNYSSEDDSNVIRNPTFTADGQPSWLGSMNFDQTPAYTQAQDPLSVPPNVLRERHRTGRPRSNSARQPAHAMAYHPYSPPSSPELPADVPLPSVRHSWPPVAGRVARGLVPYPPSDASSRDSSPERGSWRARAANVFGPTRGRAASDAASTSAAPSTSAMATVTAPSAHTPPTTSAAPSTSMTPTPLVVPTPLAAPATPTIPRRRRKRSSKKPASDLDVVIAGMSALGVGDSDADVDDLVRSMRTMRLKTRRARRRVAN
ncbi:hypothetical protein GGG16DRAFT_120467 [Schizophyllum commune]